MMPILRRALVATVAVAIAYVAVAQAVDAIPDARFVGFAETVNDFAVKSGQLALS